MPMTIRAHFDGKVIVPEEAVDLPADTPLNVVLKPLASGEEHPERPLTVDDRLERLSAASGRIVGPSIPLESLRRENLYEERP